MKQILVDPAADRQILDFRDVAVLGIMNTLVLIPLWKCTITAI